MFTGVCVILSTQDCIHCKYVIQAEYPDLNIMAMKDDGVLLLSIVLGILEPEDKLSMPDLNVHSGQRRSYSMQHFRWGKPSGRKRRPVKVFASSLEGGSSSEGGLTLQARRQRGSKREDQGLVKTRVISKSSVQNPQEIKNATYQMSHFRWGRPTVSKRNGKFMKARLRQLAKLLRNIVEENAKDDTRLNAGWRSGSSSSS